LKHKLTLESIRQALAAPELKLPRYVSPLINLANQYAQGTRPRVVGQMSELIKQFDGETLSQWESWYMRRQPEAIEEATNKIWEKLHGLRDTSVGIDKEMVRQ
jgi:hypothetical protein